MEYYIATAKSSCDDLEQLNSSEPDINNRAIKAAKLIKKTLENFRTKIRKEGFRSTEDEIHFFKYVKPKISSYLIFYSVLAEIETSKITLNAEELKLFIDKKERMFRHIMRENIDFVQYYRAGLCHLDRIYFVREANLLSMSKNSAHQLSDPEFNVSHDLVAANIMAFDLFQKHLSPKPALQPTFGPPTPKLKWFMPCKQLRQSITVKMKSRKSAQLCNLSFKFTSKILIGFSSIWPIEKRHH
jgi:hypothetical protein